MNRKDFTILIVVVLFVLIILILILNLFKSTNKKSNDSTTTTLNVSLTYNEFNASLYNILGDYNIDNDFNTEIIYEGHLFNFIKENSKYILYMDSIKLYEGKNIDFKKLYIIYKKDFIITQYDKLSILDNKGIELFNLNDVISSFKIDDTLTEGQYPFFEDNELYVYSCKYNRVNINKISLFNYNNIFVDVVNGSNC